MKIIGVIPARYQSSRLLDIAADGGNEREAVHFAFLREIEHNVPFTEEILRSFGISCI